jgi:plasmid replication initiation protein
MSNKDIIQSYILTTAKYDFSVYEKRILYRLVEMVQYILEGKKLNDRYRVDETLFKNKEITMPLSVFLSSEDDKNHSRIKKAFTDLQRKIITYQDEKTWASISIISNPEIRYYSDVITFGVHRTIYDAILDFSKGYKKFELKTAMQFESVYSMRFYELMSNQKKPIEFKIDTLKEMFSITDKYKLNADFFRFVLDKSKKELDEKSPYSFDYKPIKQGRSFYSVLFFPKYIPKNRDSELEQKDLQKQVSLSWDLPRNVVDYLKHNFEFTTDGIKNNIELFRKANDQLDLVLFLANIKGKVRDSNNPQGYVIGALRKQLK